MDEKEQQFIQYWAELRQKGKGFYTRKIMKLLMLWISAGFMLIQLFREGFSSAYLGSMRLLGDLLMIVLWSLLFSYAGASWLWRSNEKRYQEGKKN